MFSRYRVHLSAFPLLSYRSWLPGWTRVFPEAKDFSHISHRFKISPKLCCCRFCVARTLLSLVKLVKKGGGKQNACKRLDGASEDKSDVKRCCFRAGRKVLYGNIGCKKGGI